MGRHIIVGIIARDHDYAVNMIWHDYECIQIDGGKSVGQQMPCVQNHFSCVIHLHASIYNLAKQTCPILYAEGDVVRAEFCVIISP
jgi:hypothetical protein